MDRNEIDWSKAPEGAEYFAPEHGGWSEGWYRLRNERWEFHLGGIDRWDAVATEDVNKKRPLIPRPTEWRGPEDGLPPVGTVCEVRGLDGEWVQCTIVAHVEEGGDPEAVYQTSDGWDWNPSPYAFRPLKSDKERAVDAAMNRAGTPHTLDAARKIERAAFARAYDAGFLRLPTEEGEGRP